MWTNRLRKSRHDRVTAGSQQSIKTQGDCLHLKDTKYHYNKHSLRLFKPLNCLQATLLHAHTPWCQWRRSGCPSPPAEGSSLPAAPAPRPKGSHPGAHWKRPSQLAAAQRTPASPEPPATGAHRSRRTAPHSPWWNPHGLLEMLVFIHKTKSKHLLVDEPTGEKTTAKLKPTSNQTQINQKKTVPWRLPSSSNDFSHARPTPQALINALYMEVSQATCVLRAWSKRSKACSHCEARPQMDTKAV